MWTEFVNCVTHHVSFINLIFCLRVFWHTHTHTHTHASQYSETEWDGSRLLALDGVVLMFKLYYIPDQILFLQSTVTRGFVRLVLCLFPRPFFLKKRKQSKHITVCILVWSIFSTVSSRKSQMWFIFETSGSPWRRWEHYITSQRTYV